MEVQQPGDIHATLALSYEEALNGTTRVLSLPGGRQTTIPIPAGIRDGQEIRLAGLGESIMGGPAGSLILTIAVAPAASWYAPSSIIGASEYPTEFIGASPIPPPPPSFPSPPNTPSVGSNSMSTPHPQQGTGTDYSYPSPYTSSPQYPQHPRPQRRRLSGKLSIFIAVPVLLLLIGSGVIYYTAAVQPASLHTAATATAQAHSQETAQANATATASAQAIAQGTANANATATAQINANVTATTTALQNTYTQATSGTPAISDPLNRQDQYRWDVSPPNCVFTAGAYHVADITTNDFYTCTPNNQFPNFGNFALQVQMTILKGDYGGIFFRADSTGSNFYIFTIYPDSTYFFQVYKNNNLLKTISNAHSSVFKTSTNQANLITVIARGSSFSFYINGQFVTSANDSTFSSGQMGVLAGDDTHAAEVAFSNLKVWNA